MKNFLRYFYLLILLPAGLSAQITTPVIRAGFGVDADLRTNFFNGFVQSGNDDWYNNGTAGTGNFVIDTAGAAAIVAGYLSDASPWPRRMAPLYRSMSQPKFSVINNRIWLDALFVRDYHGNDSTVFTAGSDKNGMSPANWTGGIQGIPDKNDILDVFMHIRRAGPNVTDSLWMFGALSLDNVTGNRYFDFEMYQTDIYYDRASASWYGYGNDMGHTSWEFDGAGNVTKAGDIIFTAEYQSSTLTNIEARIWIPQTTLSITPAQFNWSGQYDGAYNGAPYGYASILPKTAGAFYTGMGCNNNTWTGPFQLVLQNNSLTTNYVKDQFMEFSVNLTKLGLDPATNLGGDVCGSPFNRLVVKTRASASFTAELKDFIAPIDLFLAPRADAQAEVPVFCGPDSATTMIYVTNPSPGSVYTWTTIDGNITTPPTGTSIEVNATGTYIVTQQLMAGCNPYATDTVVVTRDNDCAVLPGMFRTFYGNYYTAEKNVSLRWTVVNNASVKNFIVERSTDGVNFEKAAVVLASHNLNQEAAYEFMQPVADISSPFVDYRIRLINHDDTYSYSRIIRIVLKPALKAGLAIAPNPVRNKFQLTVTSSAAGPAKIMFVDMYGRPVTVMNEMIKPGVNIFTLAVGENWQPGVYYAVLKIQQETFSTRFVVLE